MKQYRYAIGIPAILLLGTLAYFGLIRDHEAQPDSPLQPETTILPVIDSAFGIPLTGLNLCTGEVKPNQNLSEILNDYGITWPQIAEAAEKSKEVFDVRKIRAGADYCIIHASDSLEYFVYEIDPVNYVVFDFSDSIAIYKGVKPVETFRKTASGIVTSSLYKTLDENDMPWELAIKMSEIYAWAIDFYRLQKGDRFRIIYEERYVDGKYVGLGKVHAAQFQHFGGDFYAIPFVQDSVEEYFDEAGNSLRKAFLKAPVKYSRISSGFSYRRFHPIKKKYTTHLGIDYAAPYGTPIVAVGDGVVTHATYSGGNGNYVKIRHNGTYTTQYLHMSKFGPGIRKGTSVKQGQVIGYIGSTGLSTGPHVCYRFWKNGKQVNPFKEEIPPSEPIKPENEEAYCLVRDEWMDALHRVGFSHPAESSPDDSAALQ